jgi:hypothetical protein
VLYCLSHVFSPFTLVIWEIGSRFLHMLVWIVILLFCASLYHLGDRNASYSAFSMKMGSQQSFLPSRAWYCDPPDLSFLMTGVCYCAQLLIEIGSHKLFCPGLPGTEILPISASQVTSITSMSHQHPTFQTFLIHNWLNPQM